MKLYRVLIIIVSLLLVVGACGKSGGEGKSAEPAAAEETSPGGNELAVSFSDQEDYKPGAFKLKKSIGFISGMRYNAVSTAKHAYVAFANYDVQLGLYTVDLPKEPGQIVIVVSFKTENKEVPFEQQMEAYAEMEVPTGTYEPAWMSEGKAFQVHYFVGGQEGGPSISGDGAGGKAVLTTSTPTRLAGTIDFTSPKGSTIKGRFDVKVEKDLWKK
jgi:hypothetical protein